jgi:predicted phage terminase large subunit-like protein
MQCDPVSRGGNLFKVDQIKKVDTMPGGLQWVRVWDMASSIKERMSDDPDYTVGILMAVERTSVQSMPVRKVYVRDMVRIREEAPKRNKLILETAKKDGETVRIIIERNGAYKDAYAELRDMMHGARSIHGVVSTMDKVAKASPLEAIVENGNFYILQANWNDPFLEEFSQFPSGRHDDIVDAVSIGVKYFEGAAILY